MQEYEYKGGTYLFDDDDVPAGAFARGGVLPGLTAEKAAEKPKNKAAKPAANKAAQDDDGVSDPGASE